MPPRRRWSWIRPRPAPTGSLTWSKLHQQWSWSEAQQSFRHALRLDPGNAEVCHYFVHFLLWVNRAEESTLGGAACCGPARQIPRWGRAPWTARSMAAGSGAAIHFAWKRCGRRTGHSGPAGTDVAGDGDRFRAAAVSCNARIGGRGGLAHPYMPPLPPTSDSWTPITPMSFRRKAF
jgi:hypothetical protein